VDSAWGCWAIVAGWQEVALDQSSVLRLLDVNLNRAAEGLRTLEDIARVVRQDATLAVWAKSLRHDLAELATRIPRIPRLTFRAVHSDAGTSLTCSAESRRNDWGDLVVAACERVTQSLRVIEETSKHHFPILSRECKQLRYRAYDRLAQIELRLTSHTPVFPAPAIYVLVDCQLPIESFVERLKELLAAGVGLFQIRDKRCEASELLQFCRAAVSAVGAERVVVNDRVDIALAAGAGGVHLGQDDLPIEAVQQQSAGRLWIGVSTHDLQQAQQAQATGADYIGCGPTFASSTKQFTQFAGLDFLRQVAAQIEVPAYAIGGIDAENIARVLEAGIQRVAISGAVWAARSPGQAARKMAGVLHAGQAPVERAAK